MELIFGVACDGRVYPDFPGKRDGVWGSAVLGPSGLVDVLELHLGLTGPRISVAVRIAAYASKLRATLTTNPHRFFSASFKSDPWATAKTLLSWRDQLIAAGWSARRVGSNRPDDLAEVEAQGPHLPQGLSDRLSTLIDVLKSRPVLQVSSITLVEHRHLLPPAWRRLIDAVEHCGVEIVARPAHRAASQDSDLHKSQTFLATGMADPLSGDGTLVTVEADTAAMAAEALAEWLAAGSEQELMDTVVLSPDGDTAFLDRVLQAGGLPALGQSSASPWRGALQVLPLAFAVAWKPFNPKALLDLLLLPRPPIGRSAARKLARALTKEPGTGAAQWQAAWTEIEANLAQRFAENPAGAAKVEKRLAEWREWTSGGVYSRVDGIPADQARLITGRVGQWAFQTDGGAGDPLLLTVAAAASALSDAIDVLAQDPLPALLVERMIEQVLAEGAQNPDHVATAGGLRCVKDPAAIWAPVKRVIWWDFKGPGERIPTSPWTRAEHASLDAIGCHLETPAECADRICWSYANAIHMATDCVLLFCPLLSGDEETISHPLAHQLDPVTRPAGASVRWNAERLLMSAVHKLAGRTIVREARVLTSPPQARAKWTLPATAIAKLEGRHESATSFERLVDCQMRWILMDVLRLSRGRFADIPGPDQLLGNLAHEVANRVLAPGAVVDGAEIQGQVNEMFEGLLSAIAAPLQQPEFAGELAAARARVPLALAQLANLLRKKGLEVVGTELGRASTFKGELSVHGRLDLVVRHPTQGLGVIDLKWTKSAKRRRDELVEGRALQLATYGAIADPDGGAPVPGAYYLLNQRRLIGPKGAFVADEEVDTARSLEDTWLDLMATWQSWRALAASGSAVAGGVPDAAELLPRDLRVSSSKDPCRFCELTSLCRIGAEEI